jgi:nucleoside-diphosphate-sugar epimerase
VTPMTVLITGGSGFIGTRTAVKVMLSPDA